MEIFRKKVSVLLTLRNAIDKSFQVSVEAATIDLRTGEKMLTNTFHYTFASREYLKRIVLPEDYQDGLAWIESLQRRETGRTLRNLYSL